MSNTLGKKDKKSSKKSSKKSKLLNHINKIEAKKDLDTVREESESIDE